MGAEWAAPARTAPLKIGRLSKSGHSQVVAIPKDYISALAWHPREEVVFFVEGASLRIVSVAQHEVRLRVRGGDAGAPKPADWRDR